MSGSLLFCIAEEAKAFVQRRFSSQPRQILFHLVESRAAPPPPARFRKTLDPEETFETDFIGASVADCQAWHQQRYPIDTQVDGRLIAIADSRTARDETILMQFRSLPADWCGGAYGRYGRLPPTVHDWYSFRIRYEDSLALISDLIELAPGISYPIYFGNYERFVDEHGVFDVQEAGRFCCNHDADVLAAGLLDYGSPSPQSLL